MMETMGKPDKHLDEVVKHICDDVQKRIDEAYQRGLDDAWEAARKIVTMPDRNFINSDILDLDPGESIFTKYTASEAIEKLKAYEEKQKADDEIDEKITGFLDCNGYTIDEVFNRLKRMKGEE